MVTIIVGTNSYVTRAEADSYLDASVRGGPWKDVTPSSDKDRALISAFRKMENAKYVGTRTGGDSQVTQFPRDGVSNVDGIDRSGDSPAPIEVQEGQMEFAFELSQNPELEVKSGSGSNVKRVKAGSAEAEFFQPGRDASGNTGTRFPFVVQEKLRPFLQSGGIGVESFGTAAESKFDDCDRFPLSEGLK